MTKSPRLNKQTYEDKAGQTVSRGDFIVYGHNLDRCAGLRIGKVLDIYMTPEYSWKTMDEGNLKWRIVVQGVDDDWRDDPLQLTRKKGILQFPDRTMKVNDLVPLKYRELLKDVK